MNNDKLKIDGKTVDEVGRMLDEAFKHSGKVLSRPDKQSPVPPEPIRWFVFAYVVSLAACIPTRETHWIQCVGYFIACFIGLVGVYRVRLMRMWPIFDDVNRIRVVRLHKQFNAKD